MRIMHLVKHCHRQNGNVHVAVDLACQQVADGHSVVFASNGGNLEGLLTSAGVETCQIVQERGVVSLIRNLGKTIRLCRAYKPDVIHAHMMGSAIFGFIAAKISRIPLVTTVHNSFDRHSVIMKLGTKIVAVSQAERTALIKRGFDESKTVCILNGPNGALRESWGEPIALDDYATPSIIMVCGLHKRKGVDDVLKAFVPLQSRFPEWHLNIVGGGPDRVALEDMAKGLGLDRVHFIGDVERPKPLLEKSAIFVSASYAEPCGLSIAEARACGCAMIGTAVGGTPELLSNGAAGLLFEPGDVDQLSTHLARLMSNPDTLGDYRQKSRTGCEHLSITRLALDYQALYLSLLPRQTKGAKLHFERAH